MKVSFTRSSWGGYEMFTNMKKSCWDRQGSVINYFFFLSAKIANSKHGFGGAKRRNLGRFSTQITGFFKIGTAVCGIEWRSADF